jgi:hypothetical protein
MPGVARKNYSIKIRYQAQTDISGAENSEQQKLMKQVAAFFFLKGSRVFQEKNLEASARKTRRKNIYQVARVFKIISRMEWGLMGAFITGLDVICESLIKSLNFQLKLCSIIRKLQSDSFPRTELRERDFFGKEFSE